MYFDILLTIISPYTVLPILTVLVDGPVNLWKDLIFEFVGKYIDMPLQKCIEVQSDLANIWGAFTDPGRTGAIL